MDIMFENTNLKFVVNNKHIDDIATLYENSVIANKLQVNNKTFTSKDIKDAWTNGYKDSRTYLFNEIENELNSLMSHLAIKYHIPDYELDKLYSIFITRLFDDDEYKLHKNWKIKS